MKTTFFLAVAAFVGFAVANPVPQGQLGDVVRTVIITIPGGVTVTRTLVPPSTTEWATRTVLPEA